MKNDIYLIGEVGTDITLKSVIADVSKTDPLQPVNANIHSEGGSVYEGIAIYNYFKNLEQGVNTRSIGVVASIASIFFLAGKKETRKINRTDNFLIHLPVGGDKGNASDFEKTAKELRGIESKMIDIYIAETNLTKEEAIELMNKDEMLNVDFLKEKGFVSEIVEFKAIANLINNKSKQMSEQLSKKDAESMFGKFEKILKAILGKSEPTNKMVQDASGTEINFTELEEDATPGVGDVATVDDTAANGDYTMPNGDVFTFVDGAVTEIVELVEEDEEALTEQIDALKLELEAKETEALASAKQIKDISAEFVKFKATFKSNFKAEKKEKKEVGETTSRTFRKK
jgi:ATP-dependent Clp protease protease subunit